MAFERNTQQERRDVDPRRGFPALHYQFSLQLRAVNRFPRFWASPVCVASRSFNTNQRLSLTEDRSLQDATGNLDLSCRPSDVQRSITSLGLDAAAAPLLLLLLSGSDVHMPICSDFRVTSDEHVTQFDSLIKCETVWEIF